MRHKLLQEVLLGELVNGWYLSPTERAIVHVLAQRRVTCKQLADAVYLNHDDPPLTAERNMQVILCNLRRDFGIEAFPPLTPGRRDALLQFSADALEAKLATAGLRTTAHQRQKIRRAA